MQTASVILILAITRLACSPAMPPTHSGTPDIPPKFKIAFGEGGGFSGAWSGYSITSGDSILEWSGPATKETAHFAGTLPHDSTKALWEAISAGRLLEQPSIVAPANYSRSLVITVDGIEHQYTWQPSSKPDTTVTKAAEFLDRCLHAVHQSLNR